MHQVGVADAEPRTLEHPGLHGNVGDVLRLDLGARLDLVEVPQALAHAHEHVGTHEDAAVLKRGLEDGVGWILEKPSSGLERLCRLRVVLGDQYAAAEALARQLAHGRAGVEDVLLVLGDGVGELAGMTRQPQRLGALKAGLEPRLGQAIRHVGTS